MCLALATACAPAIVSKPGFYQDKNIGFSFTWPAKVMSVSDKLQPDEVLRWKSKSGAPVLTLKVKDKSNDNISLEEMPMIFKDSLQALLKGAKNFNLAEGKVITISNGTKAAYARVTWAIGKESYELVTVGLTIFKGNKIIVVTCTAPKGMPPVEVLDNWVKAIKVDV